MFGDHQIRAIISRATGFSELKQLDNNAMVKVSYCIVLPVATAVGYSKGQMSNLGPNAPIDVLKLSPNDVVCFSLLLFCTMAEITSL